MQEASELLDVVRGSAAGGGGGGNDPVVLSVYERHRPRYNVSAVLIWAFGVFVAWIASYHSSLDIRKVSKAIVAQRGMQARDNRNNPGGEGRGGSVRQQAGGGENDRPRSRSSSPSSSG